jgi:hypothetical protein
MVSVFTSRQRSYLQIPYFEIQANCEKVWSVQIKIYLTLNWRIIFTVPIFTKFFMIE